MRQIICGGWNSRTGGDRGVGAVGGDGGGYIRRRVVCQVEYEELLFSLALEKNQGSRRGTRRGESDALPLLV